MGLLPHKSVRQSITYHPSLYYEFFNFKFSMAAHGAHRVTRHTRIHVYTYLYNSRIRYVCTCTHEYTYIYICIGMRLALYTCVIYIYIHMYTCTYISDPWIIQVCIYGYTCMACDPMCPMCGHTKFKIKELIIKVRDGKLKIA